MRNNLKIWLKQEKRTVKLLYRKGLLKDHKLENLYWESFHYTGKKIKSKSGNKFPEYMPEIHFSTTDYWGEGDEHGLVNNIIESLYWDNADMENWDDTSGDFPKSTFNQGRTRNMFIKYLNSLPTIVSDSKINQVLNQSNN